MKSDADPLLRLALAACATLAVLFFIACTFVALVVPYHLWDALAYGEWSRLIADTGAIRSDDVGSAHYHRPLFYVAQGFLWWLFGYHEWSGRLLALLFSAVLAASLYAIARRQLPGRSAAALVVVLLVLSPVFAQQVISGLSDIPAGALVALTAALLWSNRLGRARLPLVVAAAALAALAKPTALAVLGGLAAAHWLVLRRQNRRGIVEGAAAIGAGAALALTWHAVQARHQREPLTGFLSAGGVTEYYTELGRAKRWDVLLSFDWLGGTLRAVLLFAILYAVVRALGNDHRISAVVAAPAAAVGWLVLPWLARTNDGVLYPLTTGSPLEICAQIVLAASLLFSAACPPSSAPTPRWLGALLIWAFPGTALGIYYRADDLRLLGPTWAPLFLLMAHTLATVVLGASQTRRALVLVPVGAVLALGAVNFVQLDGLGESRWRELQLAGVDGWRDSRRMANLAFGPFSHEVDAVERELPSAGRVISSDGKLRYFFPGRVEQRYPTSCRDLDGFSIFVLLLDEESRAVMRAASGRDDPLQWLWRCRDPALTLVREHVGSHAVFTVGRPPNSPPPADACGIAPTPGQGFDAVFGERLSIREAADLYERIARVGYGAAIIERMGCNDFRVVVIGLPAAENDIVREAKTADFDVDIEPALRGVRIDLAAIAR